MPFVGLQSCFARREYENAGPNKIAVRVAVRSSRVIAFVALAAVGLTVRGTAMRAVAIGSLVAAAAWLPASIVLAGNLSLNFSGHRGTAWWAFTLVVEIAVLATLICALAISLFARHLRSA
jgi:hypothetical protein